MIFPAHHAHPIGFVQIGLPVFTDSRQEHARTQIIADITRANLQKRRDALCHALQTGSAQDGLPAAIISKREHALMQADAERLLGNRLRVNHAQQQAVFLHGNVRIGLPVRAAQKEERVQISIIAEEQKTNRLKFVRARQLELAAETGDAVCGVLA